MIAIATHWYAWQLVYFVKLVGNYTLKKAIFFRMWRKVAFPCVIGVLSLGFLLFLFGYSSLVCVVPSSTTFAFVSGVKRLELFGLTLS